MVEPFFCLGKAKCNFGEKNNWFCFKKTTPKEHVQAKYGYGMQKIKTYKLSKNVLKKTKKLENLKTNLKDFIIVGKSGHPPPP